MMRTPLRACLAGLAMLLASMPADSSAQPAPGVRRVAGQVVADSFWSQALGTRKRFLVWLPPSYAEDTSRRYSVAYYLHGAFGDETNWTAMAGLHTTLDSLAAAGVPELIVVMPDGDDGFYTTWNWLGDYNGCRRARPPNAEPAATYCVPWPHYDDYIARDLVAYVDTSYRTLADRAHRGIAGLSMGGYGAVALALSYPDVFSAAASHSGVLAPLAHGARSVGALLPFDSLPVAYGERLWALAEPALGKDLAAWLSREPARLAERLAQRDRSLLPRLYIDCGTGDFLIGQNRYFRSRLEALKIPFEYAEWPGGHSWTYWRDHGAESARWLAVTLR